MSNLSYEVETLEQLMKSLTKILLDVQDQLSSLSSSEIKDVENLNSKLEKIKTSLDIINDKMYMLTHLFVKDVFKQRALDKEELIGRSH